jgi:hypothetical protein
MSVEDLDELLKKREIRSPLADLIVLMEYFERKQEKLAEELKAYYESRSKDAYKEKLVERALQSLDKFDRFLDVLTRLFGGFTFTQQGKGSVKIEVDEE